jgi:hypothetical protein
MDSVDEVLAGLKARREELARELARVEKAIQALEGSLDGSTEESRAAAKRPYAYLTLYEATAQYLAKENAPRTTRQIADALRAGGFRTRSRRFTSTVSTMLGRQDARHAGIRRTADQKHWTCKR